MAAREEVAACNAEAWNWIVRPSVTNTSYHFDGGSGTLVTSPAGMRGFERAFLNGRARVAQGRRGALWLSLARTASRWPTRGRLDRRRRAKLRSRTLICRFEPAAAETREGGAPRVSGVVALRTRLRTDAADELRAPGEDVRGVNNDHPRTDAK